MEEVQIRQAKKSDIPFITNSWLHSFRNGPFVRGCPNRVYYYYQHKILEELLPRGVVLVVCNAQDPDQILGWCCAETFKSALVLHYIYIKHPFRGWKLANKLINFLLEAEKPPAVFYTHKTRAMYGVEEKLKQKNWLYNPYLLYTTLPTGWEDQNHEKADLD